MPVTTFPRSRSSGFSMIEVLVSLLIIVIGVLGMVALQSKAVPFTQDSVQRNTAMMLVDDLVEIIRTAGTGCSSGNNCLKGPIASFPAPPASCIPTPTDLDKQIGCWAARMKTSLPGADLLLTTGSIYICRSVIPGDETPTACATTSVDNTELEIQVAWTVKKAADCMTGNAAAGAGACTYRLRTRL